ncbi:uncharacterized protein LOC107045507 [Diachasma alloeum]|uniref:uncharacterized protein LOC107045507 n=1 Tax=Diachasma alloeum TaxID=454923 RepID=UPI0007384889|nr:uncharacterized protein LOC107045507 [Diachasma alloeum]
MGPEKVLEAKFRGNSSVEGDESTTDTTRITAEFVADVILLTRLAIRRIDIYSKQHILKIMRKEENDKVKLRNQTNIDVIPTGSAGLSLVERKKFLSDQLISEQVTTLISNGFCNLRKL